MKLKDKCSCCKQPVYSHECLKSAGWKRRFERWPMLIMDGHKATLVNCKCGSSQTILGPRVVDESYLSLGVHDDLEGLLGFEPKPYESKS